MSRKLADRCTNLGSNRLPYVQWYTALDVLTPYQHLNQPSSERSAKPGSRVLTAQMARDIRLVGFPSREDACDSTESEH